MQEDMALQLPRLIKRPISMNDQLNKLKMGYPILRAAKLDLVLRTMLLVQLIQMNAQEG